MPRIDPITGLKECSVCKRKKTADQYYKNARSVDGLYAQCKDCSKANSLEHYYADREGAQQRSQEWKAANPTRAKETATVWRQAHGAIYKHYRQTHRVQVNIHQRIRRNRKRAAFNDGTVTRKALEALTATWTGTCPKCGRQAEPTIDHVIPLVKGGAESMGNLQLLCRSCNSSKRDKDP